MEGEVASPVRGEIVENAASLGGRTTPSEDGRHSPGRSAERRSANLCWPATASRQRGRAIVFADEGVHSAPRFPAVDFGRNGGAPRPGFGWVLFNPPALRHPNPFQSPSGTLFFGLPQASPPPPLK